MFSAYFFLSALSGTLITLPDALSVLRLAGALILGALPYAIIDTLIVAELRKSRARRTARHEAVAEAERILAKSFISACATR